MPRWSKVDGPPGHVDLKDAARIAGCHPVTVRRAIEDGRLTSVRIPTILEHWLDERAVREWAERRQGGG